MPGRCLEVFLVILDTVKGFIISDQLTKSEEHRFNHLVPLLPSASNWWKMPKNPKLEKAQGFDFPGANGQTLIFLSSGHIIQPGNMLCFS